MQLTSVNIPAAAKYRWQHGGAKRNPKLSLWTEFWRFKNWACNYLIEKKFTCVEYNRVKKDAFMKTHHENIPAAANCSWQHDGPRRNAKLSLWTEFPRFRQ